MCSLLLKELVQLLAQSLTWLLALQSRGGLTDSACSIAGVEPSFCGTPTAVAVFLLRVRGELEIAGSTAKASLLTGQRPALGR